jgi:peptidoglycan hydrolase-like protein with peptidoglycan-binding domain
VIGPIEDASAVAGAQARLSNLGFGAGDAPPGSLDDRTRRAVMRFQYKHGLPVTGDLDGATAARLKERHGS